MRSRPSLGALLRRHRSSGAARVCPCFGAAHRTASTSSASAAVSPAQPPPPPPHQRELAWTFFAAASRELRVAAQQRRARLSAATGTTAAAVPHADRCADDDAHGDVDECEDAALAAVTPAIAQQASTAASNAALMRELGVLDRAELLHHHHRPRAADAAALPEDDAASAGRAPAVPDASMQWATAYMRRVCQTGVQAQVSSFVILRHLWAALHDTPTTTGTPPPTAAEAHGAVPLSGLVDAPARGGAAGAAPSAAWAARLPAAVRVALLQHELSRVQRRRRYAVRGVQGEATASGTTADSSVADGEDHGLAPSAVPPSHTDVTANPVEALSSMWTETVLESRAVVRCCCVAWWPSTDPAAPPAAPHVNPLLEPLERQVLEVAVRVCAVAQLEDMAQAMMRTFLQGVADITRDIDGDATATTAGTTPAEDTADAAAKAARVAQAVDDVAAWYATEADALYESAMTAAGAPRTHAPRCDVPADATAAVQAGGFPLAYSYLVHRGSTLARLGAAAAARDEDDGGSSAERRARGSPSGGGGAWKDALMQRPQHAMQLLAALAGSVDANAEHFEMVLRLYRSVLTETDAAYSPDGVDAARRAFCAVLDALARVPLPAQSYETFLDDIYRTTLVQSSLEMTHHPDVLASCLRVCSAARLSARALTLFNQLAEPASHAVAAEERNVAAVLLSTTGPASAMLQRLLSLLHTKLPVTADIVHAAVARVLLQPDDAPTTAPAVTSVVFALLDVLELKVAAQHHATPSTAAAFAQRTFFLRLVALLAGVHAQMRAGALSRSLATTAAAAMLRQWMRAAAAADRSREDGRGEPAPVFPLPPVVVGVLQELALRLRHATADGVWQREEAEETRRRRSSSIDVPAPPSTAAQVPLLEVVEGLLRGAAAGLPSTVSLVDKWPDVNTSASESAAKSVLYTAPASLQWRRTREVWPVAEQQRFVRAARDALASPAAASATAAPLRCVGFQDWVALTAVERQSRTAGAADDIAQVWAAAKRGARQHSHAAPPHTAATKMCVLTPLAEVDWWGRLHAAHRDTATASSSLAVTATPLADATGVSVPPAVGCPTHTWHLARHASTPSSPASIASPRSEVTEVVRYWLQRWLDEVEDARLLPRHGVFRVRVAQALQQQQQQQRTMAVRGAAQADGSRAASLGDAVGECDVQAADPEASPGTVPAGGGLEEAQATETAAAARRDPRSGLETMLVRGPTSLIYGG